MSFIALILLFEVGCSIIYITKKKKKLIMKKKFCVNNLVIYGVIIILLSDFYNFTIFTMLLKDYLIKGLWQLIKQSMILFLSLKNKNRLKKL